MVKLRLEEIDKQVEQECRRLVEAAEHQKKQGQETLEKTIERCWKETAEREQELGLLIFYQLGAKKERKEAMARLEAEIKTVENIMAEQEIWFRDELKRIGEMKPYIREAARKTVLRGILCRKRRLLVSDPECWQSGSRGPS